MIDKKGLELRKKALESRLSMLFADYKNELARLTGQTEVVNDLLEQLEEEAKNHVEKD